MAFEIFKWTLVAASLVGVVLNIRKRRECFYVWTATNALWCAVDAWHGIWSQSILQGLYCGLAVWGLIEWKAKQLTAPVPSGNGNATPENSNRGERPVDDPERSH